jgi:hypothetical protein
VPILHIGDATAVAIRALGLNKALLDCPSFDNRFCQTVTSLRDPPPERILSDRRAFRISPEGASEKGGARGHFYGVQQQCSSSGSRLHFGQRTC